MFRDTLELTADSVDEAVRRALTALGLDDPSQAHIVVLQKGPAPGSWHWKGEPARVRVTRRVEGFGHVSRTLPESLPEAPGPPPAQRPQRARPRPPAVTAPSPRRRRTRRRATPIPSLILGQVEAAAPPAVRGLIPSRPKPRAAYVASEDDNRVVEDVVDAVLGRMDLRSEVRYEHADYQRVHIQLPDREAGALIGRRGASIDALEHLLEKMVSQRAGHRIPLQLDVNGYRLRRYEELKEQALAAAHRVLETGREERFEPMSPRERRVIHLAVQDLDGLTTYTVGQGSRRAVVVAPPPEDEVE